MKGPEIENRGTQLGLGGIWRWRLTRFLECGSVFVRIKIATIVLKTTTQNFSLFMGWCRQQMAKAAAHNKQFNDCKAQGFFFDISKSVTDEQIYK